MVRFTACLLMLALSACGTDTVHLGGKRQEGRDPTDDTGGEGPGAGHDSNGPDQDPFCDEGSDPICGSDGDWHRCRDLDDRDRDWKVVPDSYC